MPPCYASRWRVSTRLWPWSALGVAAYFRFGSSTPFDTVVAVSRTGRETFGAYASGGRLRCGARGCIGPGALDNSGRDP